MEPASCRERLGRLISEEETALEELAKLLAREHEHLAASDVTALDETIRERQRCIARVVRSDDARRALCRELGRPADMSGLEQIMRWCDPQGTLAPGWGRCAAAAARCRVLNDGNSALVNARLQNVQARLAALMRDRGESVTYGRQGGYMAGRLGRVVKIEV
jgi:flagellar biosynthesis/type III secretory pathway chaperone